MAAASRVRAAKAVVAAVALAAAVGGEAAVAKALAEGGRPLPVAQQSAWSGTSTGTSTSADAVYGRTAGGEVR